MLLNIERYPMIYSSCINVLHHIKGMKTMPNEQNKLFFGVELEVEINLNDNFHMIANEVQEAMKDHAILKEDCTLRNGFEIVTIPATLSYHRSVLWNNLFAGIHEKLHGCLKAGLHIHFSREPFTDNQLAKIIYFFHEPSNNTFLTCLAGRAVSPAAEYGSTSKKYLKQDGVGKTIAKATYTRNAISLSQRNEGKTLEIRIFKSNPTRVGVIRALETTAAIIEFCCQCNDEEEALSYKEFLKWFTSNKKKYYYPILNKTLIEFKYFKDIRLSRFVAAVKRIGRSMGE